MSTSVKSHRWQSLETRIGNLLRMDDVHWVLGFGEIFTARSTCPVQVTKVVGKLVRHKLLWVKQDSNTAGLLA